MFTFQGAAELTLCVLTTVRVGTKYELADDSTATMLELFPELQYTTNIVFSEVSKKGTRLFRRIQHSPEQLDKSMWAHEFLSDRIHGHVREVADVALRAVPALSIEFVALDKKNLALLEAERRRQQIIMESRRLPFDRWPEYRVQLMRELLAGKVTVKHVPPLSSQSLPAGRSPLVPMALRRHTLGAPIPTRAEMNAYKMQAKEYLVQKEASVAGSFQLGGEQNGRNMFTSFHSAMSHPENGQTDESADLGMEIDSYGFII